jgi:hypothetical protein
VWTRCFREGVGSKSADRKSMIHVSMVTSGVSPCTWLLRRGEQRPSSSHVFGDALVKFSDSLILILVSKGAIPFESFLEGIAIASTR